LDRELLRVLLYLQLEGCRLVLRWRRPLPRLALWLQKAVGRRRRATAADDDGAACTPAMATCRAPASSLRGGGETSSSRA
jgi:hypothetical protein